MRLYLRLENPSPIYIDDLIDFLKNDYKPLYHTFKTSPLHADYGGLSIQLTQPCNEYVFIMCIDLTSPLVGESYHLSVEIPDTDRFLPIKNDYVSIEKAISAMKDGTIPMFNDNKNISPEIYDYARLDLDP